jgi:GAF domain-containing protein
VRTDRADGDLREELSMDVVDATAPHVWRQPRPNVPEARRFAEFSVTVAAAEDMRAAREQVVRFAASLLGTPWVALARPGRGGVRIIVGSGEMITYVGRVCSMAQGAGVQACLENEVVLSDDLTRETRWPDYARELVDKTPVRSVLALPMRLDEETAGALLLYAPVSGAFDAQCIENARILVDHANVALSCVRSRTKAAHLQIALRTSREIGMAVGIIMDRLRLTETDAFGVLEQASQLSHIRLRELAAHVVESGELPQT